MKQTIIAAYESRENTQFHDRVCTALQNEEIWACVLSENIFSSAWAGFIIGNWEKERNFSYLGKA